MEIRIENKAVMNYRCTGKFRHSDGVRYALRVLQKMWIFSLYAMKKTILFT